MEYFAIALLVYRDLPTVHWWVAMTVILPVIYSVSVGDDDQRHDHEGGQGRHPGQEPPHHCCGQRLNTELIPGQIIPSLIRLSSTTTSLCLVVNCERHLMCFVLTDPGCNSHPADTCQCQAPGTCSCRGKAQNRSITQCSRGPGVRSPKQ